MKIVIDARESGTTTGRYVDKLIENLQKIDSTHDYQILYKSHRLDKGLVTAGNFHEVRCDIKEFTFAEQTKLKKQIESLKPDLTHFAIVQQPVRYKGNIVTTMHDLTTLRFKNPAKNALVFTLKQKVYAHVNRVAAQKSKFILTATEYVKNDIIDFAKISPEKIIVTYESADKITAPAEPMDSLIGQKFIMYVGRPQPHKNLGRLIEALQIMLQDYPDLKLVLAGKKDVLFLQHEKRAGELGLSKSVVFTDFVSEGQLRWLYENCAAYVFPSLSEGFGLPGLEAMIHGAPVVSSNATCLPEVNGDAAHYFDPLDIKDMAEKISDVIGNTKLRQDLISKGFTQSAKYSWSRMAEQTLEVYKKALL